MALARARTHLARTPSFLPPNCFFYPISLPRTPSAPQLKNSWGSSWGEG
eukprot:CAMPEP_0206034464 /NCGR_PEP_ID=MMETSP1466-20131121/1381_1 /ASSEMBLY_ACC=CAM_ASM_001126 /TAXON_ID=44452 /ORGANISM="Pavlova gyrans, Strain CCMP608" /LENGTH=48 /DNA_ID= /DNA_START= /DNA_END= /DNA_ORIENTATION=